MAKKAKRISLYQCGNAKVYCDEIRCSKGYWLGTKKATVPTNLLRRGAPLELTTCQGCADLDYMGEQLPAKERGWIQKKKIGEIKYA